MTEKKKPGRQPFKPTPEQRKLVEQLAAFGTPQEDICNFVHDAKGNRIGLMTLHKYFRAELDTAETKANSKVAQCLFYQATIEKNVTAMIFWLKTRARWRETERIELTGKDGGPIESKGAAPETMSDADLERIARSGRARTSKEA